MEEIEGYDAEWEEWERCVPIGFYRMFRKTPREIFGREPEELVKRQLIYIAYYLDIFVFLLQKKLHLDFDLANGIAADFILKLFASPAIKQNVWGRYRYYITRVVLNFARKRLNEMAEKEGRELTARQRWAMRVEAVVDYVQDRIFNIEYRQIRRALENGLIDDYLNRGTANGELTNLDCIIWHLHAGCHFSRREIVACREIAESREHVNTDTVKNTLRKIEKYFSRHAAELRLALREL